MTDIFQGHETGESARGRLPVRSMVDVLRFTSPDRGTVAHLELEENNKAKDRIGIASGETSRFEESYANSKSSRGIPRRSSNRFLYKTDVRNAFKSIKEGKNPYKLPKAWTAETTRISREELDAERREDMRLKEAEEAKLSRGVGDNHTFYAQAGSSKDTRSQEPSYQQPEASVYTQSQDQDYFQGYGYAQSRPDEYGVPQALYSSSAGGSGDAATQDQYYAQQGHGYAEEQALNQPRGHPEYQGGGEASPEEAVWKTHYDPVREHYDPVRDMNR